MPYGVQLNSLRNVYLTNVQLERRGRSRTASLLLEQRMYYPYTFAALVKHLIPPLAYGSHLCHAVDDGAVEVGIGTLILNNGTFVNHNNVPLA